MSAMTMFSKRPPKSGSRSTSSTRRLVGSGQDEPALLARRLVNKNLDAAQKLGNALNLVQNKRPPVSRQKRRPVRKRGISFVRILEIDIVIIGKHAPDERRFPGLPRTEDRDDRIFTCNRPDEFLRISSNQSHRPELYHIIRANAKCNFRFTPTCPCLRPGTSAVDLRASS